MPGATYLQNYQNQRLNEIVIPGAHDAGLYTDVNQAAKTQSLNLGQQAAAGCRFFDLRVAMQSLGGGRVAASTYHSPKVTGAGGRTQGITLGSWGDTLGQMLTQAMVFVLANPTEFLILKFSKSYNYTHIADQCRNILGHIWYTGGGNLNTRTVQQLSRTVVTLFEPSAQAELTAWQQQHPGANGILYFKELYDSKRKTTRVYDPNLSGLQYFGKYSQTQDIGENAAKQARLFSEAGAAVHMDAVGMMYWTTTNTARSLFLANIRSRNDRMWGPANQGALAATWRSGLQASIQHRLGREWPTMSLNAGGALGGRLKSFMPNIVMMDFVDVQKCTIVDNMNQLAAQELQQLVIPAPAPAPAAAQPARFVPRNPALPQGAQPRGG
jgi:hypothetical protein